MTKYNLYTKGFSKLVICALAGAGLIATTHPAKAALLVYDGFDYSPGVLAGNNGGFGWTAGWAQNGGNINNSQVFAGGFSYTDTFGNVLVTSGNRAFITGDGGVTGANLSGGTAATAQPLRILSSIYGLTESTTWVSFLALRTDAPSPNPTDSFHSRAAQVQFFYNATTTATAQGTEHFGIGRATQSSETDATLPNDTWAAIAAGAAGSTKASLISFVTPPADFILMRIDHVGTAPANGGNAGNADTLRVWINPTDLTVAPSDASANIVHTSSDFTANTRDWVFDRIRLFGGNPQGAGDTFTYGQIEMDEFRLGTTFGDVTPYIPEPTVVALLGIGALAAVLRFRRNRA